MAQIEKTRSSQSGQKYVIRFGRGKETAQPAGSAATAEPAPRSASKLVAMLVVLVIFSGAGYFLWKITHQPKDPIPATIKQSVSFNLYYPAAIPKNYKLDPASVVNSSGTIFYNLVKNPGDPPIVISQQQLPKNFDPKSMFQHSPLPTASSPLGTIYDLSYKGQSRFMLATNDSLVFVSSNTKLTNAMAQQIIEGLKASK